MHSVSTPAQPDAADVIGGADDFRAMFEATSVGMVQADPITRRLLRVNAAFCAITGYDEAELLAMTIDDVTHPEDRERDRDRFARMVQGETASYQSEKRYLRKDGSIAWVEATANPVRDGEGRLLRTVAMIQDVTARKEAEAAAAQARVRVAALAEATQALIVAGSDPDAVLAAVAHHAATRLGDLAVVRLLSADGRWLEPVAVDHPDPAVQTAAAAALAMEQHPASAGANGTALRAGRPQRLDPAALAAERARGNPHLWPSLPEAPTMALLAAPLRADGRTIGTLSVSRAVAGRAYDEDDERFVQDLADRAGLAIERARLFAAVRASEERLRLAVAANRMVAWEWDPATDQITTSDTFAEIYGLPALAGVAAGMALVWPEDVAPHQENVARVAREGGEYQSRFRITRPRDGRTVWLEERAAALTDDEGRVTRVVGVVTDITAAKEAEERGARLHELAAALNRATTPTEVYRVALEAAAGLGAQGGSLYLRDGDDLGLVDATGFDPALLDRYRTIPLAASIPVSRAVRRGRPVFLRSKRDYARRYPDLVDQIHGLETEGAASLPLRCEGRVLGALNLTFAAPLPFNEAQRRFLLTVADLVAQALERSRHFAAARVSEANVRRLADAMPQFVWAVGANGQLSYVNERWTAFSGLSLADTNDPVRAAAVYHPEDGERVAAAWAEAFATGAAFEIEARMRGPDGIYRWFLIRGVPGAGTGGDDLRWFGTSTDITSHKEAEARLEMAQTAGGAGFFDWRVGDERAVVTGFLRRLVPANPVTGEIAIADWRNLAHPDDARRSDAAFAAAIASGSPSFRDEFRIVAPLGEIWLAGEAEIEYDADGVPRRIFGINYDITARKEAEAQIAAANERFARAEEAARAFSFAWEPGVDRVERSAGLGGVLGYEAREIAPTWAAWGALIHPDDRKLTQAEALARLETAGNGSPAWEYRVRHKDGRYRWVSQRGTVIRDAAGHVLRVVGHVIDVTERKAAEAALAESEARFRALTNAVPSIIWMAAPDGTISHANDQWFRYAGIEPEDNAMQWPEIVLHPDDHDRCVAAWAHALATGEDYQIEVRNRRHDGEYRWFLTRAVAARDANGAITGWYGSTTDVHEAKLAQERLRDSEERLRLGVEVAGFALAEIDYETGLNHLSAEAARLFGLGDEAMVVPREQVHATFHHDDRDALQRLIDACLDPHGEGWFAREHRIVWPNGEVRWLSVRKRVYFDRSGAVGRPVRATLAALDVTERNRAEATLRESEERYATLANAGDQVVWRTDAAGGATFANDAWQRLTEQSDAQIRGFGWLDAVHPDDREAVSVAWLQAIGQRQLYEAEFRVVARDGTYRHVLSRGVPLFGDDGEIREWIGVNIDITARQQAEAERIAFLDALAHDVKNPLGAAKGQAQLARRRLRRGEEGVGRLEAGLDAIETGIAAATGLIDELLDIARLRAGHPLELHRTTIDLVAIARECADEAQRSSPRHLLRLEAAVPSLTGVGDEARLRRVMGNLLGNALKYSPEGGEVVVRVGYDAEDGAWATLSVQDQGVGIPERDLPRVFDRFHRAGNVASIGGTGIGLAGSQQIVDQHGGTIAVESTEGKGSTFTVRLPLA